MEVMAQGTAVDADRGVVFLFLFPGVERDTDWDDLWRAAALLAKRVRPDAGFVGRGADFPIHRGAERWGRAICKGDRGGALGRHIGWDDSADVRSEYRLGG